MNRNIYLDPLEEMSNLMLVNKSPLAEYVKVVTLSRMMMKIEDIYNPKMNEHPYIFTEKLIKETILMI